MPSKRVMRLGRPSFVCEVLAIHIWEGNIFKKKLTVSVRCVRLRLFMFLFSQTSHVKRTMCYKLIGHVLKPETTKRNHRNETAETTETTETKRPKPAKRPKRNHRNNRNETESETAGTVKRRLWSRSPGNRLADRVCDVTNSRQNPSVTSV